MRCIQTCLVNKIGSAKPWCPTGWCTTTHGKCLLIPIAGSAWLSASFMISLHCCLVKSIAIRAYASLGISICLKQNSTVTFAALACAICIFQVVETSHRCFASSLSLLSGANQTPSFCHVLDGSNQGMMITCSFLSLTNNLPGSSCSVLYCHLLLSQ